MVRDLRVHACIDTFIVLAIAASIVRRNDPKVAAKWLWVSEAGWEAVE
jgi:hypothetical protein